MKVIKRDGRAVDFDREKIRVAIEKANQEVRPKERATKEEIKDMDSYVRQDIDDNNLKDEDIFRINEKIKDLEKQILNVIEG